MKYPSLVPDRVCTTPCHVKVEGDRLTGLGQPILEFEADLKCNLQEGARTVLTDTKKEVLISGVALFNGDAMPSVSHISGGEVTINNLSRRIYKGFKARNPDGSVNYTRLELI